MWCILTGRKDLYGICRETARTALGDSYCELTHVYVPRKIPLNHVKKVLPELFRYVEIEVSRKLKEEWLGIHV